MEQFFDLSGAKNDLNNKVYFPEFQETDITFAQVNKKVHDSNTLNDKQLRDMIKDSYKTFLDKEYIDDRRYRQEVIDAFCNTRFLEALVDVMRNEYSNLTYDEKVCCNKITWDYKCQKEQNDEIRSLLTSLSDVINRDLVILLSTIVSYDTATLIALARYSSFDIKKDINRVNFILVKFTTTISVQNIIDIYSYLYKSDSFSRVFGTIMFDSNTSNLNSEELERYGRISIAVLTILEKGMSSKGISIVLRNYANSCAFYPNMKKRFSMWGNSKSDYPRVYAVLQSLENIGVTIP